MTIKAALLDAAAASGKGKYIRIDELADESALTENHVPEVTECDLPPGRYVWDPKEKTFVDQATIDRRNKPSFELAVIALAGMLEQNGFTLPEETRNYCAWAGERKARLRGVKPKK